MGWPVEPAGLTEQLLDLKRNYGNPPVYVMENGADYYDWVGPDGKAEDAERIRFIRIAEMAPLAVQGMKQALNEIGHGALDREALAKRIAACKASADLQEGIASFAEKRKPVFKGR